jgi:hypothetical protein
MKVMFFAWSAALGNILTTNNRSFEDRKQTTEELKEFFFMTITRQPLSEIIFTFMFFLIFLLLLIRCFLYIFLVNLNCAFCAF